MPLARRSVLLSMMLLAGCRATDRALNPPGGMPPGRLTNDTRAAVFAQLWPSSEDETSDTRPWAVKTPADRSPKMPADRDGFFVGLSLSGGGSRSANFSAAVMFQLEQAGLLQHVDYISSVSGGSLAGAYYCASGAEWNPGNVQTRLAHSFAGDALFQTLLPWNMAAFFFTDRNRSDLLAESFQQVLFTRNGRALTYGDLRPDRPRLLINATDLQSGHRFIFSNETFDELNSNLSRYPLAYAVTASAAVPLLLHPVTVRDYSTVYRQYRHLIDGSIRDNLGVQTLVATYAAQVNSAQSRKAADPYPHGAVFIIVDAQTNFNADISGESDLGLILNLKTALGLTSTLLLNRASSATLAETIVNSAPGEETVKQLREQLKRLKTDGFVRMNDQRGRSVSVIYISLSQIHTLKRLPTATFSERVNNIDTYFNIAPTDAFNLYQAARLLMKEKFQTKVAQVVHEIESGGNTATTRPASQKTGNDAM